MKIFKYLIPLLFFSTILVADELEKRKNLCNGARIMWNTTKEQVHLDLYKKNKCWEFEKPIKIQRTKDEEIEYLEGRIEELERENRSLKNEIRELKNK